MEVTAQLRRRVFIESSQWKHRDWTVIVAEFYDELLAYYPRLALRFQDRHLEPQVRTLATMLRLISWDLPDRAVVERFALAASEAHKNLEIGAAEFAEFNTLLADVLSRKYGPLQAEAGLVWYEELTAIARIMRRPAQSE